jgi:hypothetical protein
MLFLLIGVGCCVHKICRIKYTRLILFFSTSLLEKYPDDAVSHDGCGGGLRSLSHLPNELHLTSVQFLRLQSDSHDIVALPSENTLSVSVTDNDNDETLAEDKK